MDGKAVNIYAYNDDYGVFFYNGTNDSRDAIDALVEDSKTTLKPKYDGFKITKIDGLEPETEIFTEDKAVGNGIFITGSRVPEQYIDIVAVGAGLDRTHIYYKYAKDFHKVGEWYKLNIQYQGRWVKAYGILKAFKIIEKRADSSLQHELNNIRKLEELYIQTNGKLGVTFKEARQMEQNAVQKTYQDLSFFVCDCFCNKV